MLGVQDKRPNTLLMAQLLEDLKRLNNPLTPLPERISIARTWYMIVCYMRGSECFEEDPGNLSKELIDRAMREMVSLIAREIRSGRVR